LKPKPRPSDIGFGLETSVLGLEAKILGFGFEAQVLGLEAQVLSFDP